MAALLVATLMTVLAAADTGAQNAVGVNSAALAPPASETGRVISTSGPVRLVFDRVAAVFNNRIVYPASANLGFVWSNTGGAACADGIDNDDHIVLGLGRQDGLIDFPADPECVSPDDASEDKAGLQQRRPVVFAGELDGEGRLLIPSSGIDIPTVWAWNESASLGGDQVYVYDFEPIGGAVGVINPFTRELGLHVRFRIRVSVEGAGRFTGPGENCYVGSVDDPIAIRLTTIEAHSEAGLAAARGIAYDADTGAVKLVGYNMGNVAGAADCGAFGALNNVIGAAFGVPSAPGNIQLTAVGRIEPPPRPAEGATPNMVRLPRELFPTAKPQKRPSRTSVGVVADADTEVEAAETVPEPPTSKVAISVAPGAAAARVNGAAPPALRPEMPAATSPPSPSAAAESPAPELPTPQAAASAPPTPALPTLPPAVTESSAPVLPKATIATVETPLPGLPPAEVPVPAVVRPDVPGSETIVPGPVPAMGDEPPLGAERIFHSGPESHLTEDPAAQEPPAIAGEQEGADLATTEPAAPTAPAQADVPAVPTETGAPAEQPDSVEIGGPAYDAHDATMPATAAPSPAVTP